ncbi:hypothetical protein [Ectopseudomonas composti]|uniref:hypothetical protein n=1 Tax=Ectopseudomonas composti TaxID=658457 RepID=UPI0012E3F1A9|nr:hypothetical protein [Pseudomonas composti]
MHEILQLILDWLSTKQGSGPRNGYGWEIIVITAFAVGGLLKARENHSKKISLKYRTSQKLLNNDLTADILSGNGKNSTHISAKLEKIGNSYIVTTYDAASPEAGRVQEFCNLDEVEKFLEKETIFRLSDFSESRRVA